MTCQPQRSRGLFIISVAPLSTPNFVQNNVPQRLELKLKSYSYLYVYICTANN